MSINIQWKGGDDATLIPSGSYVGFYGSSFNQSIPLNTYNQTTFVTNSTGTLNTGTLPNVRYTSPGMGIFTNTTHGTISGSISSILAGTGADMTLHIQITSGSAVYLTNVNLIAFSGISINQSPQNATVVGFESGSSSWAVMDGISAPLALTPSATAATTHDYYVGISIAPTSKAEVHQTLFAFQADWYR